MLKQPLPATECSNPFSIRHSYIEALSDFPVNLSLSLWQACALLAAGLVNGMQVKTMKTYKLYRSLSKAGCSELHLSMNTHEHAKSGSKKRSGGSFS